MRIRVREPLLLACLLGAPAWGQNKIVFHTIRDGNDEIYAMNSDGTGVTNLTNDAASDEDPSWSRDNTKIAFDTFRDGNREIYVMDADGSNQTRLTTDGASDTQPKWSPVDDKIVFQSIRDGNWEIYVMNADGSGQANLTNNASIDVMPHWSPDGSKIVFQSDRDGNWEIYVMDADGTNQTALTNDPGDEYEPAWSPDGTKIAFHTDRDGNQEIYVMDADGSNQTRLTTDAGLDKEAAWSPDGAKIAFASNRDGNYEIYVMDADGSNQVNRTNDAAADEEPSWQADARLTVADHDAGQEGDAFGESGSEYDAELFAFKLDPGGESITVTQLAFSLSSISGLADADWAGVEIVVDDNGNGSIGAGETTTVGGAGAVAQAAGTVTFSASFNVSAVTHYILRATFASLSSGDKVTIDLSPADITASKTALGSPAQATHREGCFYIESFQAWSATTADTWEIKDLGVAPFNVPANTVVEVAIRNSRFNKENYGGVRAVGSGLDRRLLLQEAEDGGVSVLVMHVQTDAGSQIRHYSGATADVDFVLLGYWECGTYVEAFQAFTAGGPLAWETHDLDAYGVGSDQVSEIVMANEHAFSALEAGVRTNGSSLQRRLDLQEAEAGGVETATMFVAADATANATIEIYAEDDFSVTFYLVGYFTASPRTYTELFETTSNPATNATWETLSLSGYGVPADAVAEFSLANSAIAAELTIGVRENVALAPLDRRLNLQEAEAGGRDLGRMHVTADGTSTIEFYHELVGDAPSFYVTGYWAGSGSGSSTRRVIRWTEVDPYK